MGPAAALAESPEAPVSQLKEPEVVEVAARPEAVHPFAAMAGSWAGGGTISLTNDINEKLRCRANHSYGQRDNSLALNIRCASDNYKIELTGNVVERRGQVSGQWKEVNYNAVAPSRAGSAAAGLRRLRPATSSRRT